MITASAGIALTGVAGCLGSPSGGDDSDGGNASGDGHDDGHDHGGGESTEGGGIGEPVENAEVAMKTADGENHFEPHVVRVVPGGTVTFTLESGTHSATAYASDNDKPQRIPEDATAWDSGTMNEQGATFEHTFETEGVYDYYCSPHESLGMVGSVVVGDPSLDDQPGLAEPQDGLPDDARSKIQSLNERVTESLE